MITIEIHVLETMNKLKTGVSAQDVRFGYTATVLTMEVNTSDTLNVLHSFFK